jgi:hypothetical protein
MMRLLRRPPWQFVAKQPRPLHHPRLPLHIRMLAHAEDIRPLRNQMPRHMQELAGEIWVYEEVLAHSGSREIFVAASDY